MAEEDEEEASDAHIALLLLLLPIVAKVRERLKRYWKDSPALVGLGELIEEDVVSDVQDIMFAQFEDAPPDWAIELIDEVKDVLERQVARARVMLLDAETFKQAERSVDVLEAAVSKIESIQSNIEVRAENESTVANSRESTDENVVWDSERDACVRCLAYAGKIMDENGSFDGANKFGAPSISVGLPPLHPNCRCKVRKVSKRQLESVVTAMEREAERSIIRGFSRPSESNSARIRATRTLLNRGSSLPASVQAYGRRSIRQGDYPRGRDVP